MAEGISVDEIQNVYSDGFGIRKSEQMRKEKAAVTRRFRDEEANAGGLPDKMENSTIETPVEHNHDTREKTSELL